MRFPKTILALCGLLLPTLAAAQTLHTAETAPDADQVIALYPGVAPGSEAATWHEQVSPQPFHGPGGRLVRNVVQPTLTVFRPPNPARATGTAVIIAPGGGFRWLSIDSEGYEVARALAARGVTAIVLKYRLNHTPDDEAAFQTDAAAFLRSIMPPPGVKVAPMRPPAIDVDPAHNPGIADGLAALRYVRAHAADLGVDPHRIGIMGFSAGGFVTNGALTHYDAATRPDFAAQIYAGAAPDIRWASDTPPVFLAIAGDDFLIDSVMSAFTTLRAAQVPVELHVFNKGGHGFGMIQRGLTTDLWIDEYAGWLASLGLLTPRH